MNINGLKTEGWKAKNDMLRDFFIKSNADAIALQETKTNWMKMPQRDRWEECTIGQWEEGHYSAITNSLNDISNSVFQRGGCILISTYEAKCRVCGMGKYMINLGYWTWARYRGRKNNSLRVILAYLCSTEEGAGSVFNQYRRYL